ncbi:MAG: uroporphyrinogen decarboxylase family protein [Acidimicrobiia bacterium]|nr:uroporphyrinogen decarboxylase family protein [Acidimicrobiia bacterium]
MSMTPRERVLATIDHREPDRVPIVLGVSNATGIKMRTYREIKQLVGIVAEDRYLYDWPELGTADPDEATLQRLGTDVRGVWDLEPDWVLERNRAREPHSDYINSWGSGAKEITPGEWFPMVEPLKAATSIAEIEDYPWPDMHDPTRVAHVGERAARLALENQYAIMATPWLLFPLERAFAMQGMDTFLMNMAMYPDFAEALLWRIEELCKELMLHFLEELGDNVDIIKIGDDLGTQESLLMSPAMYRQMLKPVHADYIQFIKQHTRAQVMFHTDGDVFPLIDDFIEMGVDILNPIQTSAGKMSNLTELKQRFGDDIIFCGGMDTARVLPQGTPEEVRQETRRIIEALGQDGGLMIGAVHTVMNDVPAENVLAMVDAVEEFGHYPLEL